MLLALLGLASFALRVAWVTPRRAADQRALRFQEELVDILAATRPEALALPGAGTPIDGEPVLGPLAPAEHLDRLEQIETDLGSHSGLLPGALRVPEVLGPTLLLLGKDRRARRAYEEVLARGDSAQRARARVGLGIIALRVGLRMEGQDRAFALEHALQHFEAVPEGGAAAPQARFDSVVAQIELARYDAARDAIVDLRASNPEGALVLGTLLLRREGPTQDD